MKAFCLREQERRELHLFECGAIVLGKSALKRTVLEGEKVRLRPVTEDDVAKLLEWDEDEEISRWAGKKFFCREEAKEWYLNPRQLERKTLAIEADGGKLIGEIELLNISWKLHTGELRVFIGDKEFWDKGFGTDAVYTFLKAVFETTSIEKVFLRVDEDNVRARRCYVKVGFVPTGRVRFGPDRNMPARLMLMEITRDRLGARPSSMPAHVRVPALTTAQAGGR